MPEVNLTVTGNDPQLRDSLEEIEILRLAWGKDDTTDVINLLLVKKLCKYKSRYKWMNGLFA